MEASHNTSTSPSLLVRVRDPADHKSWEQFVEIYTTIIRDYCFQRRLQKNDIDDLVQEVMTAVSKSIRTFEYDPQKGRFRAWLGTITANKINSFLAKQARRNGQKTKMFESAIASVEFDGCSDPDSEWVAIFSDRIFKIACATVRPQFSDQQWQCFEASWLNKTPANEIAESLGIAVHLVYVNTSRVLKKLEAEVRVLAEDTPISNGDQ